MILQQLTLRNFGLYCDEHLFDLAPAVKRQRVAPIILFGGINGGGKTTILDAIQLVLYGNRARCSKRGDKAYDDFLRESIHHGVDPAMGAAVQLGFRFAAEGEEHLYEVTRAWSVVRDRVKERVEVHKGGELDGWLSDNWNQVVEELIPFGIAQLCFFDAEKIRFLAEDETSSEALGLAIKSLLGLDLAERLVADAGTLETRLARKTRKSPDLEEATRLEAALKAKQDEIERVQLEKGAVENPRQRATKRLKDAEEAFAKVGGKLWKQREQLTKRRGELEFQLRACEERLVMLSASELPLVLVAGLVDDVSTQVHHETAANETDIITRLLAKRDEKLLALLKLEKVRGEVVQRVATFLEAERPQKGGGGKPRLRLSDSARRGLEHLLSRGLKDHRETATSLLAELDKARRELEQVQRSIAATPDEEALRGVSEELQAATSDTAELNQQALRLEKQLETLSAERAEINERLKRLRRKVLDEQIQTEEEGRMAALLQRTQGTMKQFLRLATHRKIDRLSGLVSDCFRYLLRKKTLVQRVLIAPDTFAITLVDDSGRTVAKERLSEGEKQIFAISVLWGLSQASARPLPAIIDTPMARLDVAHRRQLVEKYFPRASHQVIILSTDTEIERNYFHELQPHIARAYHLNYDEARKQTVATEGYFWDAEPRAEGSE